jgi:hypothetical protein
MSILDTQRGRSRRAKAEQPVVPVMDRDNLFGIVGNHTDSALMNFDIQNSKQIRPRSQYTRERRTSAPNDMRAGRRFIK